MEIIERKDNAVKVKNGNKEYWTLDDILPNGDKTLEVLIIGKVPTPTSVKAGHYYQGSQGQFFWKKLKEYGLLNIGANIYEDNALLENNWGITDVVKEPNDFSDEPTAEEYRKGLQRIKSLLGKYKPRIIVFVYKKVLDYLIGRKSVYGFNYDFDCEFGTSKVFVFPMKGTPCKKELQLKVMDELKKEIEAIRNNELNKEEE